MSAGRPVVFLETHLLEATEERLVLKIPLAAAAVLLHLKAGGAPSNWLAGTAIVGGGMAILPWHWMQGIAFGWSRLRPATGRLELRRSSAGGFSLRLDQKAEEMSVRRGLFYLDLQGICTLVLVVGRRVVSVAFYLQTGGSGVIGPRSANGTRAVRSLPAAHASPTRPGQPVRSFLWCTRCCWS
jgi:hypothetical protein